MKRWLVVIAILGLCVAPVGADVTITTTTTIEGPAMSAAGGGAMTPKTVARIKGNKSRTDIEVGDQSMSTLVDLTTKETILLNHGQKTVQNLSSAKMKAPAVGMPKFETTVKPTGKKREITGQQCDEYAVTLLMDMSSMAADKANAAAILKDVRMTLAGFVWVAKDAPGSAEYLAFQSGAAKLALSALTGGRMGPMPTGLEALMGFAEAPGIPYLTELTLLIDGTGPMVEMAKQMGQMKITSRVASVSVDQIPATFFEVPKDYVVKQ